MIIIFIVLIVFLLSYLYNRYSETQYIINIDFFPQQNTHKNNINIKIISEHEIKSKSSLLDHINKSIKNAAYKIQNKSQIVHHCFVISSNKDIIKKYNIYCKNIQNRKTSSNFCKLGKDLFCKNLSDKEFSDMLDYADFMVNILHLIKEAHIVIKKDCYDSLFLNIIDLIYGDTIEEKIFKEYVYIYKKIRDDLFDTYKYKHINYI